MKKSSLKSIITILFGALFCISLASCKNFMNSGDVKDEIEKQIEYNNAQSFTLIISQDTTMGSFLSSGEKKCKVGYSITVQFNLKKDIYIFKGLKAVNSSDTDQNMNDYVEFQITERDDQKGIYKVSIKLLKEANNILIMPDCSELPAIIAAECKPDITKEWEQDSTIRIVFNKPVTATQYFVPVITDSAGQNLAEYFEKPYFSGDSKTLLIPTNKNLRLVDPAGTVSSKDIIVSIDLTNIIDEDGNSGIGTAQHKYRVGKAIDSVKPILSDIAVYSSSDENYAYYKEISPTAFDSWTAGTGAPDYGDFGAHRVTGSVYVEFEGTDEGSGISGLMVKETHYKYTDGSAANIVTASSFVPAEKAEASEKYCVEYDLKTPSDGIILLEFYAEDSAENISATCKSVYVLKDTLIDSAVLKFNHENDALTMSASQNGHGANLPDYAETIEKVNSLYTNNADGTQTVKLTLKDNAKDIFYSNYSSPFDLKVYWGYDENNYTEIVKAADNSYSFKRDPTKIVFLKIDCKDTIGNEKSVNKIVPPALELQSEYDSGSSSYKYTIANLKSYLAMCNINTSNTDFYYAGLETYNFTCSGADYSYSKYITGPELNMLSTNEVIGNLGAHYNTDPSQNNWIWLFTNKPQGTYSFVPIALFGDFPSPLGINDLSMSITSWDVQNEQSYVFPETDASEGKKLLTQTIDEEGINWTIFTAYGKELRLANSNSLSNTDISQYDVVLGFSQENKVIPVNEKINITVTPVKNLGMYEIEIADYKNTAYQGLENVSYLFYVDTVIETATQPDDPDSDTTFSYYNGYAQRDSKTFLVLGNTDDIRSTKFTVRVEAYDKATRKYYVPALSMVSSQGIKQEDEQFNFAFRNILRMKNTQIGETSASQMDESALNNYIEELRTANSILDYIATNFKQEDYNRLQIEDSEAKGYTTDISSAYNGFKDKDGKKLLYLCDLDVTPPELQMDSYIERSFLRMPSPKDKNLKINSNGKAELSYYVIPSQSNDLTLTTIYTQKELETYFAKYKQTLEYYPRTDSNLFESVVIPFGNTKQGINIVYIVAEDASGNSSLANFPILTTSFGRLPITIGFNEIREYPDPSNYGSYNSYFAWDIRLDFTKRSDILVSNSLPQGLTVEMQYLAEENNMFYWNTPEYNSESTEWQPGHIDFISTENPEPDVNGNTLYKRMPTNNPLIFRTVIKPDNFSNNPSEGGTSYNQYKWGRISGSIQGQNGDTSVKGKGYFYSEYIYTGADGAYCNLKNCTEGMNGYLVYSDRPVLAHTMFSMEKLTDSIDDENACSIWENEGAETGLKIVNDYTINLNEPAPGVLTGNYGKDNLKLVPSGAYYTTIFHFADGDVVMTEIKQKK